MKTSFARILLVALTLLALSFSSLGITPASAATNNALNFDGVDDDVKTAATLALGGDITYEAWIQTSSTGSWSGIVTSYSPGDPFPVMEVSVYPSGFVYAMVANTSNWYGVYSAGTVNDGQWHHMAVTYATASETFHIYIDGVDQALTVYGHSGPITDLNVNSNLVIGKNRLNNDPFNGAIDEVRAWNVVRTQAEIQANMASTVLPQAGLMAYYQFNQGAAGSDNTGITTAQDDSGNSYTGTLNNFALTGATSNWVSGFTFCYNAGVVTNNADSGAGSLRQAITDACAGGTITFDTGLSGQTIALASTLTIDKSVTINGSSLPTAITIDGGGAVQLFDVKSSGILSLDTLTLANGFCGPSSGLAGGAIGDAGAVTVRNSTVLGNIADQGGAIFLGIGAQATIVNSTFTNNIARATGGAINSSGTLNINNSSLIGNSTIPGGAAGDAIWLYSGGVSNFTNSIFTKSNGAYACVDYAHAGVNSNNIGFGCPGDIIGGPTDFTFGALAPNGGPTQTMSLPSGSPALNAGDGATCETTDQRGITRPQGAQCDIGAFEVLDASLPSLFLDTSPSDPSSSSSATFTFHATDIFTVDPNFNFWCQLDGGAWEDGVNCLSGKTYTGLADGSHTFKLDVDDEAGNKAGIQTYIWTVAVLPETAIDSGPSGTIATNSATFTYHAIDTNITYGWFDCMLDPIETSWQVCDGGTKNYTGLSDGAYTFHVRAWDDAGNVDSTPASQAFTVSTSIPDTTPPDTTITPAAGNTGAAGSFSFTGSDNVTPAGSLTFECRLDFGFYGTWGPCTSPFTYDNTFPQGVYTLNVRAIDAALNTDATPATATWTLDYTAPVVTINSGPAASLSNTSATFAFSVTDNLTAAGSLTIQCGLDGAAWENCTSPKTYTGLALGHHWVWIQAIDAGGNIGQISAAYAWDIVLPTTERLKNGGFEIYGTNSKIPLNWKASKFGALDGKTTAVKKVGKTSLKINGGAASKTLTQTLTLSGAANDLLVFSYWIKGSSLPKPGTCQVQAIFYNGSSNIGQVTSPCPTTPSFNWKLVKWNITVMGPYTKVMIKITFKKATGAIWLDGMSLKK